MVKITIELTDEENKVITRLAGGKTIEEWLRVMANNKLVDELDREWSSKTYEEKKELLTNIQPE